MSDSDDMVFEDAENWRSQKNSIREEYMRQVHTCVVEGSKELTRGGLIKRVVNGEVIEQPRPDQIEIYSNCVEQLMALLWPEIVKHQEVIKPFLDRFHEHIAGISDSISKATEMLEKSIRPPRTYDPNLISFSLVQQYNDGYAKIRELADKQRYEAYKELFKGLQVLLNYINYGEEGSIEQATLTAEEHDRIRGLYPVADQEK